MKTSSFESPKELANSSLLVDKAKTSRTLILLSFLAVYIIWGSTYLGIKYAIETFPPFLMAGIRFLFAGGIMYVIAEATKAPRETKSQWKSSFLIGFLLLVIGNGGLVWAEQFVPSGIAALLITIEPIWVVILQLILKKGSKPGKYIWLSFVLAFTGMFMLVGPSTLNGVSEIDPLGVIIIMLSTLGWAAGSIYASGADTPISQIRSTALQMIAGAVSLLLVATPMGEWAKFDLNKISIASLNAFIYLIIFGSIIGYSAYSYLTKKVSPAMVSTYAYVNPIIAVFLGSVFGNEAITTQTYFAAMLLISSVVIILLKTGK